MLKENEHYFSTIITDIFMTNKIIFPIPIIVMQKTHFHYCIVNYYYSFIIDI